MPTGYEGYQLSELERIAYESQNFLAQEIIDRCSSTVQADYKREVRAKQGVWKQDERKEPTVVLKHQYYYKHNNCEASDSADSDCICWRDEGTGPYGSVRHDDHDCQFLTWRTKPSGKEPT